MLTFSCLDSCLTEGMRPPTGMAPLRIWLAIFSAILKYKLFLIIFTSTVFVRIDQHS